MSRPIQMRLGEDPSQEKEESKLKEFAKGEIKDELIDISIDKVAEIANISIPLSMLEAFISVVKSIEKSLENIEQTQERGR